MGRWRLEGRSLLGGRLEGKVGVKRGSLVFLYKIGIHFYTYLMKGGRRENGDCSFCFWFGVVIRGKWNWLYCTVCIDTALLNQSI